MGTVHIGFDFRYPALNEIHMYAMRLTQFFDFLRCQRRGGNGSATGDGAVSVTGIMGA